MPEVGIVMTLRDRMSNTMKSMINSGKALSKEFDDLLDRVTATENQQAALAKALAKTKTAIADQTDVVKASEKAWKTLRKEKGASAQDIAEKADAYHAESEKLEVLRNQLNEYTLASKDARQEMKEKLSGFRQNTLKEVKNG